MELVSVNEVRQAFSAIAGDLARACEDAGESTRIHIGDLTDAVANYILSERPVRGAAGLDTAAFYSAVRAHLKALYIRGRGQYVTL